MAKLVIIADGARFKVTSNTVDTGWDVDYVWPVDIEHVTQNGTVILSFHDSRDPWELTFDGSDGTWEVDSVLATDMLTNAQLAEAIADMKG